MKKLSLILLAILTVALIGCKKDDDNNDNGGGNGGGSSSSTILLQESSKTLHHGDTYEIKAVCENPITYTSENDYVAEVNGNGIVHANYVGITNIILEDTVSSLQFKVTVAAESNLYTLPNINFGETRSTIISRFGNPDYEDEDGLLYERETETIYGYMIVFDDTNKVYTYVVIVKPGYGHELANVFIPERYAFLGEADIYKYYMDALDLDDASTIVSATQETSTGYWIAAYMDKDYFRKDDMNSAMDAMQNLVKKFVK
ncbi:MAG: hypothetical protein IKS65_05735 [Bacteroidales bacterium]|nr:hypothetical protein [Bacteroidales bacterium]